MIHERMAILAGALLVAAGPVAAQSAPNVWRMSKLAGLPVYGPGDTRVGTVSDVLVGQDGVVQTVVVGVGGLLGLGGKDVALPFDRVRFTTDSVTPPVTVAAQAGVATTANGSTEVPGTMAPMTRSDAGAGGAGTVGAGTGLGAPNAQTGEPTEQAARERSRSVPDHAVVGLTRDQLEAAPAFRFAP